jgi:hypothetical protein
MGGAGVSRIGGGRASEVFDDRAPAARWIEMVASTGEVSYFAEPVETAWAMRGTPGARLRGWEGLWEQVGERWVISSPSYWRDLAC